MMTEHSVPPLPILMMKEIQGAAFVFSSKPEPTPWSWLSLLSLIGLAVCGLITLEHRNDALILACSVCALCLVAFGSIYLVMRRSHRTAQFDFSAGTLCITEALGAEKETRWEGEITEIESYQSYPEKGFVELRWPNPESTPERLAFASQDQQSAFLKRLQTALEQPNRLS